MRKFLALFDKVPEHTDSLDDAMARLIKDGLIVLTPKGYLTRSRNEVRRSKGGQRCDTD